MASSSGTKLTKYESAVTIVTAAVANSLFGGLYGTSDGESYEETDPLVAGHSHDGQHIDGHSQKINLVSHVTGQLRNINLANDAVTKRNVDSFSDQAQAIPEYETISGTKYYYLDLTEVYDAIEDGFGVISVSANGGVVDGDGAGDVSASSTNDTLNLEAGANITISRTESTSTIKISGNPTDAFSEVVASYTGRGTSNNASVTADDESGSLTIEADDGVEVNGTSGTDTISIRNRYAFSHLVQEISSYTPDGAQGWGSEQVRAVTQSSDSISYKYLQVGIDDIYTYIPIPQSLYPERPISFIFRAYFIASENGAGFLSSNEPTFGIDLQFGSRFGQTAGNIGTFGNNEGIFSDTSLTDFWSPSSPIVLAGVVSETDRLYVAETSLQTIVGDHNPIGLLAVRMEGQDSSFDIGSTNPFDGSGTRAELHFLKSDLTWFI
jgi:hypothetical protein